MLEEPPRRSSGFLRIAGGIALLVIVGFLLKSFLHSNGDSSGGLFSSNDCTTNEQHDVPKEQLKGVGATMTAQRCSGSMDASGNPQPYVLVSVAVNGSTKDKSQIRNLDVPIRLERQKASGGWQRLTPTDIPKDSGVSTDGNSVAYEKQVKWQMRRAATRVHVAINLATTKGNARTSYVFLLP